MLMQVKHSVTKNGIRVITSDVSRVESTAVGVWAGVGSRHEPAMLSGISHFTEHLLFKGTRRRSARDITVAIEGRGGYINAFTGEENTCFYARVAYDRLESAMDVLTDMYMHSRFDPKEIDKERGVIMEEIMMYRDQPRHLVQELLSESLWPEHPLGRPIIGTPETLRRMNQRAFRRFVGERYVGRNTVVAVAGKVDHADCVAMVERLMHGLKGTPKPPAAARVQARPGPKRTTFLEKEIEQTHLALGFRLFGYRDERRHALKLLSAVLGENMSSRLFQIVREKHGLAYSVHSHVQLFRDSGALTVSAGLDRKRKVKALDLIVRELRRLKEHSVGAGELRRAKDYVIGQLRLGLESTSHQMMWIGENLLTRGRFTPPEETMAKLEAVRAEDVRALAGIVLRAPRAGLAVVSPDLGGDEQRAMRVTLWSI